MIAADAVGSKPRKPLRIDLHEPHVLAAARVAIDGSGISSGLDEDDSPQKVGVDRVEVAGLVETPIIGTSGASPPLP